MSKADDRIGYLKLTVEGENQPLDRYTRMPQRSRSLCLGLSLSHTHTTKNADRQYVLVLGTISLSVFRGASLNSDSPIFVSMSGGLVTVLGLQSLFVVFLSLPICMVMCICVFMCVSTWLGMCMVVKE